MPLTTIFTNQDALIEVNEVNSYLQITWLQHPSSESFRHIVTLASQYAADQQLTLRLCDMRKLFYLLMSDQNWSVREIYAALDLREQYECAYLVSKAELELYTSFRIHDLVAADPQLNRILQIEIFFEESLALEWLLYQS